MSNKIKCIWISVDCANNDPVDVYAGGPTYLGYDFCVMECQKAIYSEYIMNQLSEYGVPLIKIEYGIEELREEDDIDNEETIADAIMAEADYIIDQAKRNYKKARSR